MKEIQTLDDIKLLVNTFYGKVRQDDLLGVIFNGVIQDNWEVHLQKMYSFWETVLLENLSYRGSPFLPHMKLPVEKEHFDRWLKLFCETLDTHFEGAKAEEAKWRAHKMAEMFYSKIVYYRSRTGNPLI